MKKPTRKNRGNRFLMFLLPGLAGLMIFYIIPFVMSLNYSMRDSTKTMNFVGLQNFSQLFQNPAFTLALKNTLLFIGICVPLIMATAYLLASGLRKAVRLRPFFALAFMLPLVIPSGAVVYFWTAIFGSNGLLNVALIALGSDPRNWLESGAIFPIVILIFIWKNVGYSMVLFWVGLDLIPAEYYEFAQLEGAGPWATFRHITGVYLMPTTFLVLLMSIIDTFKSFREIYMLLGPLPQNSIYMLQHYIINQFTNLNLPLLSAAATVLAIIVTILVCVLLRAQKRLQITYQ